MDPKENTLTENSVKKEYSTRKKFVVNKREMGDAHCDDQESSSHLQKRLKHSKEKCYNAIPAVCEGRNNRTINCLQKESRFETRWRMRGGDPLQP